MKRLIRAVPNHPFNDPWKSRVGSTSRVGRGPSPGWYVYCWMSDGVGWVFAKDDEAAQELLNMEPVASLR